MYSTLQKMRIRAEALFANDAVLVRSFDLHRTLRALVLACLLIGQAQASLAQCPTLTFPETIPTLTAQVPTSFSVAIVDPPGNYTYSIIYSNLPAGLSLDTATGIISGTPEFYHYDSGEFLVQAVREDSCVAQKEYNYVVETRKDTVPFPDSLPKGKVGIAYYASVDPGDQYAYGYYPGSPPPGLSFNDVTGEITGIPTTAGTFQFTTFARSYQGYREITLHYTIVIEQSTCSVTLPATVPSIPVGQPYLASFAASPAGSYSYAYFLDEDDSLPPGLAFDTTSGQLAGSVTAGTYSLRIEVQATDVVSGCTTKNSYLIFILCPLEVPNPPTGKVGVGYQASIAPSNAGYSFSSFFAFDALPPGLTLSQYTGAITGTPLSEGTYTSRVSLIAKEGCYVQDTITLTIEPATATCSATGYILRETWVKVKGYDVRTIPVTTPPTATRQLTKFEGPANVTNEYGDRIHGYICPPASGNYTFWIASDDNSALYLSSDDQPSHKQRIAWVNGATQPQEWTKYASQQSVPIHLEANKKYYIESLHKEAYGNDHLAVGWQLPGGALERPIPGKRLSPFVAPANARTTESEEEVAQEFAAIASLSAAPNPFTDQTTIRFSAQAAGKATVAVYDLNGSLVKVLFAGELKEGETKELTLEGAALPSGVYLVKATSPAGVSHLKLVLTK